jgi:hypothetical protein
MYSVDRRLAIAGAASASATECLDAAIYPADERHRIAMSPTPPCVDDKKVRTFLYERSLSRGSKRWSLLNPADVQCAGGRGYCTSPGKKFDAAHVHIADRT